MGTVYAKESFVTQEEDEGGVDLSTIPARVQKVHIKGVCRTKNDILGHIVKDLTTATDFEDMVKKTMNTKMKFEALGIFKKVYVSIDTSHGIGVRGDGYEVTYRVKEVGRIQGGVNTLIGTNEGSVIFAARMPNTFGRAERVSVEYNYGSQTSGTGVVASFIKPIRADPNIRFSINGYKSRGEYPWSGYKELNRGISSDFMFPSALGQHNVRLEGVWRETSCMSKTTAFAVREQCGHSLKCALVHSFERDQRDDRLTPRTGTLFRVVQELAGGAGDAHFLKHDVAFQANAPLPLDSSIQLSLAGGLLRPLPAGNEIKINDRFFIGGPLSLRGFNVKGVGPHEDGSALGSDCYWQTGLHLYTPLPFRPGKKGFGDFLRTHCFVNAGNLGSIDLNRTARENLSQLGETFRLSYGAGIVLRLGRLARMELNYCIPLRAERGDSVNPGFQFGIGVTVV